MLSGFVGLTAIEVSLCGDWLVWMTSVLTLAALETGVVPMGFEGFCNGAALAPASRKTSPPSPAVGARGLMLGTSRASSCSRNSRVVQGAALRIGPVAGPINSFRIQKRTVMRNSSNRKETTPPPWRTAVGRQRCDPGPDARPIAPPSPLHSGGTTEVLSKTCSYALIEYANRSSRTAT